MIQDFRTITHRTADLTLKMAKKLLFQAAINEKSRGLVERNAIF